jgi:hypothetical protein
VSVTTLYDTENIKRPRKRIRNTRILKKLRKKGRVITVMCTQQEINVKLYVGQTSQTYTVVIFIFTA